MEMQADQSNFWFMLRCVDPLQLISQQPQYKGWLSQGWKWKCQKRGSVLLEDVLVRAAQHWQVQPLCISPVSGRRQDSKPRKSRTETSAFWLHPLLSAGWQSFVISYSSYRHSGMNVWKLVLNGLATPYFKKDTQNWIVFSFLQGLACPVDRAQRKASCALAAAFLLGGEQNLSIYQFVEKKKILSKALASKLLEFCNQINWLVLKLWRV